MTGVKRSTLRTLIRTQLACIDVGTGNYEAGELAVPNLM